jgi:hypothetical protein
MYITGVMGNYNTGKWVINRVHTAGATDIMWYMAILA